MRWHSRWLSVQPAISAIAGDTDGIDGSEDNAGAMVFPDSLARGGGRARSAEAPHNNDSPGSSRASATWW